MYLYVITDGEFQKIGTATNPHTRVKELQTGNPRKLHVLKTFEHENAQKLERAFHYLMDSGRQQGEWFKMTERELHGITMVLECFNVKSASFYVGEKHEIHQRTEQIKAQCNDTASTSCKKCGKKFKPVNSWHTFCCPTCKDDYHNEHNPERKQIYRSKRTG